MSKRKTLTIWEHRVMRTLVPWKHGQPLHGSKQNSAMMKTAFRFHPIVKPYLSQVRLTRFFNHFSDGTVYFSTIWPLLLKNSLVYLHQLSEKSNSYKGQGKRINVCGCWEWDTREGGMYLMDICTMPILPHSTQISSFPTLFLAVQITSPDMTEPAIW